MNFQLALLCTLALTASNYALATPVVGSWQADGTAAELKGQPQTQDDALPLLQDDAPAPAASCQSDSDRSIILKDIKEWTKFVGDKGRFHMGNGDLAAIDIKNEKKVTEECSKCFGKVVHCSKVCVTFFKGKCDMFDDACIARCTQEEHKECGESL
eukprot:Pgem_evm1s15356